MIDEPQQTDDPPVDKYSDWYGFDTENDQSGKVTLACLIHESGAQKIWHKAGHLVEWCDKQQKGTPVIICHNLEYDLVNEFGEKYPYINLNYLKGRLISARYGRVRFLDSGNHFRMTLKSLGESLGIQKKEMDIYSEDYVATDAWICLKAMTQARDFIAALGGQIGATSGSSSVSVWRHMTDDEYCTGALDTPWLRKSYYGGRTEIFRVRAEGDVRGYDINSMYPFCMINEFPEWMLQDANMDKAKGVAEVDIFIPTDLPVSPLCWRDANGRLLYPVGFIHGTWTYDEIRFAESLGAKVSKVHKALGCHSVVRPFTEYIEVLYAKRKASDNNAERLFLKVLMNSLYGKIASKNQITRTVSKYNLLQKRNPRIQEVKWINKDRGLLDYFTPQLPYVNVAWGSMITAYSRILLTKYLLSAPPESLIYCDTDSVYVLDHQFKESKELGKMKLEKQAKLMVIKQPKAYQLDDQFLAKGVPRPKCGENGEIEIDFARQYFEHGETHFMAPIRFRASLNSHRGKANQWVEHKKSLKSGYTAKTLSNGRYFPPVIGQQLDMFSTAK